MRILHVIHQYLPEHIGGTEYYAKWLSDGLTEQGHAVAIFARHSADGTGVSHRNDNGTQIWTAWNGRFQAHTRFTSTFHNPPLQQAFNQTLDQFQPDIVHIQHLMGLPTAITNTLQQRHIPYIITLHDFWWICANAQLITNDTQTICAGPDKFINCARCTLARANQPIIKATLPPIAIPLALRNRNLRHSLQNAAQILAPSHFVKNWYEAHGIAQSNIKVLSPGIDYPTNLPKESDEKRPFRVGYIGGLSSQKGVHNLIQAFTQLPTPCQLWIAGDTTFDPTYVAQLQQQATANVTFLGKKDRAGIWQMLTQVDVVVVPSIWYETFCFVISEAHAMRIPVIAANIGALAERIQHGQDGYLYPPNDADALHTILAQLQADPAQLKTLQNQIAPVPTFHQHLAQIKTIYKQQINTP